MNFSLKVCSMLTVGALSLALVTSAGMAVPQDKTSDKPNQRDKQTSSSQTQEHHGHHMRKCAEICASCQVECDSCFQHCAAKTHEGSKEHAVAMRACVDCAEACKMCASLCARQSAFSTHAAECCAKCCEDCAAICEKMPDDKHMAACAKSCHECAKACRDMANGKPQA